MRRSHHTPLDDPQHSVKRLPPSFGRAGRPGGRAILFSLACVAERHGSSRHSVPCRTLGFPDSRGRAGKPARARGPALPELIGKAARDETQHAVKCRPQTFGRAEQPRGRATPVSLTCVAQPMGHQGPLSPAARPERVSPSVHRVRRSGAGTEGRPSALADPLPRRAPPPCGIPLSPPLRHGQRQRRRALPAHQR